MIHAGTFFGDMLHTFSVSPSMIYAFEPVLEIYMLAKLNVDILGLDNVILINSVLSSENGVLKIGTASPDGQFAGGRALLSNAPTAKFEHVTSLSIDSLPTENVCLIQFDIEGHKKEALLGAVETIKRSKPIVLIEDNRDNCAELLTSLGYEYSFKKVGLRYWATGSDSEIVSSLNS